MKKILLIIVLVWTGQMVPAQKQSPSLLRVEPPSWWTGMQDPDVQLMIYGHNIATTTVHIDYPGVQVEKVTKAENSNYLFIDLRIAPETVPGDVTIDLYYTKKKKLTCTFPLNPRENSRTASRGLDAGDVIYLVTPDRFVNADTENDAVKGLKEGRGRPAEGGRHGGDLQGVFSKIDYMKALGVTALWLNPVLENNMPEYSYHGYATTDYYKVDPRYGSNEQYKQLAAALHENGLKLIMDMIFNHCGAGHWWMNDKPFADWIHHYRITNHAISALSDPHGAESDCHEMEQGWFVTQMPDLNHDNPFMAAYLIQNSIWWIEYAGLDGIRMDTYPYNKKSFMAQWAQRIYKEYPDFYLVGETWVDHEGQEAYWAGRAGGYQGYNSHLNSITDFPLCQAVHRAFQKDGQVYELYRVLSKDFLYDDPAMNKIFADNHDMDRFYHTTGHDLEKFKLAMTFLLTTRGIPQLYYGTEILMQGHGPHGIIRQDFPGGWPGDERNAFNAAGRTAQQNEAFDHLQKILHWRAGSDAIRNGSLKHFVPHDNVYVYNRRSGKESVMVVINNNAEKKTLDMERFAEIRKGYDSGTDIITGKSIDNLDTIEIEGNRSMIIKLNPELKAEK